MIPAEFVAMSSDWRADYRVVPYVSRPGAPIATASSWRLEARRGENLSTISRHPFVCGVSTDEELYCWHTFPPVALSMRLGSPPEPRAMAPGMRFRDVTANSEGVCGVTFDGRVYCF